MIINQIPPKINNTTDEVKNLSRNLAYRRRVGLGIAGVLAIYLVYQFSEEEPLKIKL